MQEFRGIHVPSRRLPGNYLETQVLAWEAMKEHPAFLEHWVDLTLEDALYDPEKKVAEISLTLTGEKPLLRFSVKGELRELLFNAEKAETFQVEEGKLEFRPSSSGNLLLAFL